jgi:drug/metabolite transporter (DMT)-like permease
MPLWAIIAVFAAFAQTARNAGQKHLSATMSAWGATWVRFLFGLPFAAGYLAYALDLRGEAAPDLHVEFLVWCAATAIAQILATVLLVHLFSLRNFAVGSSYARTETIPTAVLGAAFFGEAIDAAGWTAILVSGCGVMLISLSRQGVGLGALAASAFNRAAGIGLLSGLGFALASLFLRQASLSLDDADFLTTASMTLVTVIAIQTVALGIYVAATRPTDLLAIGRAWKAALFVGFTSAAGSAGWFTAMTIERASYVKAVGQVEFVLAIAVSVLVFKERPSARELIGMSLVAVGIVVLLVYAK